MSSLASGAANGSFRGYSGDSSASMLNTLVSHMPDSDDYFTSTT